MHPKVNDIYQELAEKYQMTGPFLEIGGGANLDAILSGDYFQGKPNRIATKLSDKALTDEDRDSDIQFIRCNSQNMRENFADGQFGTVLSNAVLEHDKYFWRSLDEMKRVLAPGGILVVGAPGYIQRSLLPAGIINEKIKSMTATMDVHSAPDYWRFSRSAFKEVICEGLELLEIRVFARVPTLIAVARMPPQGLLPPVPQEERRVVLDAVKAVKLQKREARAERLGAKLRAGKDRSKAGTPSEMPEDGTSKPHKATAAKQAKLDQREARQQARETKLRKREAKVQKAEPPEISRKALEKEAKLQARDARLKARETKLSATGIKAPVIDRTEDENMKSAVRTKKRSK